MSSTFRWDIEPGSVAVATVRGVPDVVVLRRACYSTHEGQHWDWAHTKTNGFTCSNDDDVTDITHTLTPAGVRRALRGDTQ